MEAPERFGEGDVIGIVVDGFNCVVSFFKNRTYSFSVQGVLPQHSILMPAITLIPGSVVSGDYSYARTSLIYADVSMRVRANEERRARLLCRPSSSAKSLTSKRRVITPAGSLAQMSPFVGLPRRRSVKKESGQRVIDDDDLDGDEQEVLIKF
jgi:hypothetical protein